MQQEHSRVHPSTVSFGTQGSQKSINTQATPFFVSESSDPVSVRQSGDEFLQDCLLLYL